jgi:UDP-apiose/xylose synthase
MPDYGAGVYDMKNNSRPTTLCILGCGGFIGSHLLERLANDPAYRVIGIDTCTDKIETLRAHPSVTVHRADIQDLNLVYACIEKSDIVIALAALCNPSQYTTIPAEVVDSNFTMPRQIVEMCARSRKWLIHFSTCEVYGKTLAYYMPKSDRPKEEDYLLKEDETPLIMGPIAAQRWCYASAKQLLERVIYAHAFTTGLPYTIVRPFNFIGPRMDYIPGIDGDGTPRVVACFMHALMNGTPLRLVDGGNNRRVFTYIDDAIEAILAILQNPQAAQGQIFNIGAPGNETTIAELAIRMGNIYRNVDPSSALTAIKYENVTAEQFYGKGYDDSDRRVPDIAKARSLLGWEPKTGLDSALAKTVAWYHHEYRDAILRRRQVECRYLSKNAKLNTQPRQSEPFTLMTTLEGELV